MISAETRQQRRHQARRALKGQWVPGKHVKPFRRAIEAVARIQAIVAKGLQPTARQLELNALPAYKSRGHGKHRSRPGRWYLGRRNAGAPYPMNGARECERRRIGGFYTRRRTA